MPPRDPRLCPALDRALPADDRPGPVRMERIVWEVLFGDGAWHPVTVRARRTDRLGRDVVDVEWYSEGENWSESYVVDEAKLRAPA
jgi:hypothetical protein